MCVGPGPFVLTEQASDCASDPARQRTESFPGRAPDPALKPQEQLECWNETARQEFHAPAHDVEQYEHPKETQELLMHWLPPLSH